MTEVILINITPFETRVAITEQEIVQELHIERSIERGQVGNIYFGQVLRVLPGMQSAFVDIGLERAGFIHVADLQENATESAQSLSPAPIEKMLFEGQRLIVQVIKDSLGTKGARLSTKISLAGRMLVYLPYGSHIGISKKIEREQERQRLNNIVATSIAQEIKTGGIIVRTQAEGALQEELHFDLVYLSKVWLEIQDKAIHCAGRTLLYQDLSLAERVLRDMVRPCTQQIKVDSRVSFAALKEWAKKYTPSMLERITYYNGELPLFNTANVEQEITRALLRRVDLNSGGYLTIDQTEALTTIDVNTGRFVGKHNFNDTIFKTNLEAAAAIARQLRLRNLGGMVILDFIDMTDLAHRETVLNKLKTAIARDRTRTTVHGFSPLGLVEITRKRTRESLAHQLCEPCVVCQTRGYLNTSRTTCYKILREVLHEARQFNPHEFRILAAQNVIDLFLEEESQHLAMLKEFIGKPISLEVQNRYSQEQYDIILLKH